MPPSKRAKALGRLIRDHREEQQLSQREVARRIKASPAYVKRVEQGDYDSPAPKHLQGFARVLAIPLEDLYALAGYEMPDRLPGFSPYLRSKFDELPDAAVAELEGHFERLRQKYAKEQDGKSGGGRG